MDFRPLRLSDQAWMTACRDTQAHPFTALSFPSLFTWRNAYRMRVAGDEDFFVVHSVYDGGYYSPCGENEKCRAFLDALDAGSRVLYLTQEQAAELAAKGWTIRHREDLSEYISSTQALALHGGHMSNSYKVKCRHFGRDYSYHTHLIGKADEALLLRFLKDLESGANDEDFHDLKVLEAEIAHREALNLRGLVLETDNGRKAFILGYENKPDMFTMSMSKHDPQLPPETMTVCVHELAMALEAEYSFVNLEEDLGLEGLRRAKELYSPIDHLRVYEAVK